MTIKEYEDKAKYFRELGQTAIADNIEELIMMVKMLQIEKEKLNTIITLLLKNKR